MTHQIIRITDKPQLKTQATAWFHAKWGIPLAAYQESIEAALTGDGSVPQWYLVMAEDQIIGGAGIIENDFHTRKDLTPNVCAVYVEEDKRCQGIAGELLAFICQDMQAQGIGTLYLVTDHTSFYERYGWEIFCMAENEEGGQTRVYRHQM